MHKNGVVVGRFQPFHNGHLEYVLKALEKSEHLYIGVTTPGETATQYEPKDSFRLGKENNPYSYEDRVSIIKASLSEVGLNLNKITFVHFDPSNIAAWHSVVPKDAVYFLLLLGDEREKVTQMKAQGLEIEILDMLSDRKEAGGDIRKKIANGEPFEHLVPKAVAVILKTKSEESSKIDVSD